MIPVSRHRKIAATGLTLLLTLLFCATALAKLTGAPPLIEALGHLGLADMRVLIGAGELAAALLYAFRKTSAFGTVLLSALMGGAICAHMAHGEPYVVPSVLLLLVWLGQFWRAPGFFLATFQAPAGAA